MVDLANLHFQDIYRPMLQRLAVEGISAEEKSTFL